MWDRKILSFWLPAMVALVALLGALFVLAGCSTREGAKNPVVTVVANEWGFTPSTNSAKAGQITLEVVNQGRAAHEVVVLRADLAVDALLVEANGAKVNESALGQQIVGEVEDIGSGQTKSVTLNLSSGRYVLICNLPGHYKAGMVSELTVTS